MPEKNKVSEGYLPMLKGAWQKYPTPIGAKTFARARLIITIVTGYKSCTCQGKPVSH